MCLRLLDSNRSPFCWCGKWGWKDWRLHAGTPTSERQTEGMLTVESMLPALHCAVPPCPSFHRPLPSSRSLQEHLPQSTLQWCFPWLQRTDMIGPCAEELGGILRNQYWCLQEAALPGANWRPSEHFQNCGRNHLPCAYHVPTCICSQSLQDPFSMITHAKGKTAVFFRHCPVTPPSQLRTLVLWLHNRQPADTTILKHHFFRVYHK